MASHGEGPKNDQANEAKATKDINGPEPGIIDAQQSSPSPRDLKRSSTTPYLSAASSAANSPKPSREGSPTRPSLKSSASIGPRSTTRSRKNSQDLSPIRAPSASGANIPTVPSAAAIQRALSAAGTPHFPSPSTPDFVTDSPRPQKANRIVTGSTQQAGSNSPRVKSPPLSASSGSNKPVLTTARKIEQSQPTPTPTTPTIIVDRPTRSSTFASEFDVAEEDHTPRSGMRTPSRGISGNGPALETVQESSFPATPAISTARSAQTNKGSLNDRPERIDENPMEEALGKEAISRSESGNESPGNKSGEAKGVDGHKETRKPAAAVRSAKPPMVQSKKSFSQLPFTKAKTASEGGVRNLIVETETVSSIPQVALGGGAGERTTLGRTETGGSLRLKPSNETIRPKKEKKKVVRKAPSVNSGAGRTVSSKADIFEAKVASAVDEANSSDSEETFVYESNPPEPSSARSHRYHSRTPSATSTVSQMDHYGIKGRQDGHHSIVGKRSMKFANNYSSIGHLKEGGEGTVRGPSQNGRTGNTAHHHHIGRYGRNGHTSLFDSESPFPNATKPARSSTGHLIASPKHAGSRSSHLLRVSGSPRKSEEALSYDLEGEGADDERTPLVGSVRAARNRRRPLPGSVRHMYSEDQGHRFCGRITAFTSLSVVLALLIAAIIAILVLCTKPLTGVYVKDIRNVLASEQELMLDLHVQAINPNLIAVQISDLDVLIHAKSKHVGTGELWRAAHTHIPPRKLPSNPPKLKASTHRTPPFLTDPSDIISQLDGIDEGTDPIDDPETDSQTMLLGQIVEFDSPLIFEPSPIRHQLLGSTGEVRLAKPGNRTEEGGSQRWEHVIQHDFELIVRGTLRYSLPFSSHLRSVLIARSVVVHPTSGINKTGSMKVSEPSRGSASGNNILSEKPRDGVGMRIRFAA